MNFDFFFDRFSMANKLNIPESTEKPNLSRPSSFRSLSLAWEDEENEDVIVLDDNFSTFYLGQEYQNLNEAQKAIEEVSQAITHKRDSLTIQLITEQDNMDQKEVVKDVKDDKEVQDIDQVLKDLLAAAKPKLEEFEKTLSAETQKPNRKTSCKLRKGVISKVTVSQQDTCHNVELKIKNDKGDVMGQLQHVLKQGPKKTLLNLRYTNE